MFIFHWFLLRLLVTSTSGLSFGGTLTLLSSVRIAYNFALDLNEIKSGVLLAQFLNPSFHLGRVFLLSFQYLLQFFNFTLFYVYLFSFLL